MLRGSLNCCLGTCAHRSAGTFGNEIDAQPSDNGCCVVFVQTVEREAVVEKNRRLVKHLTSHLEVHLGACLSHCLCGRQELFERWPYAVGRHTANLSGRPRPGKRLLVPECPRAPARCRQTDRPANAAMR
jgi:hypothetical protein